MDKPCTLHLGDCLQVLATLPDNSVDSIVTDPPYGLAFMGKRWDYDVPSVEIWQQCLRVLKPGGHLLAFAGTRTQHRMAVRIEDAGFEIRDMIAWVYGSGFPKSLDVSKAIDKVNGEPLRKEKFTAWMRTTGVTAKQIDKATGTFMGSHYTTHPTQPAIPTPELWKLIRPMCGDVPDWVDDLVARIAAEREVVGQKEMNDTRKARAGFSGSTHSPDYDGSKRLVHITVPATHEAKQWAGWGTALKPALEPITLAAKPSLLSTADNVMVHGVGGINIDGCRVLERWPTNFIHDGSEEASNPLGSAARFFYCAKASKADRDEGISEHQRNAHPTVKPTELMRYLCRLVTPPNGIVLDPFMGSGSTGKAARLEGFKFIGIERESEYLDIARARIEAVKPDLFS